MTKIKLKEHQFAQPYTEPVVEVKLKPKIEEIKVEVTKAKTKKKAVTKPKKKWGK